MADRAKHMAVHDTDWSTVPIAAISNVLRAVDRAARPSSSAVAPAEGRALAQDLCREVGIDPRMPPDARVPYHQLADLYDAAARRTGDPWFGLRVGASVDVRSFDLVGYLALTSASLDQVFEVITRYLPLWTTSVSFEIECSRTSLAVVWSYADPTATPRRHDCEMSIMSAIRATGLLEPGRPRPREIHFRHPPPADTSEHVRLLRAPVRFDMPRDQFVCDADTGATPIATADPVLHELLRDLADQRLVARLSRPARPACPARPARPAILDDTTAAIAKLLPSGDAQLPSVARTLGIGERTLQRRLIAAGTSFSAVLAAVRRDRATHALAHSDQPISDLALDLGYTSSSELHRAVRRWVGVGPRAYRRARR